MRFQPKTSEEIAMESLLPEGEYDAVVIGAEEKTSSKGNDMIELRLKVFDNDGDFYFVTDFILEKYARKLRHFCESACIVEIYNAGELTAADCLNAGVRVKLVVQPGKDGYDPKNSVKDYLFAGNNTARPAATMAPPVTRPMATATASPRVTESKTDESDLPF